MVRRRFVVRLIAIAIGIAALSNPLFVRSDEPDPMGESLFDGLTLKNWKPTKFGGEGEVSVEDGAIRLAMGSDLTGVTWAGAELPKENYEISLEARRVDGGDFFCGLTAPVSEGFCTFVIGGWGGGVVGISSIDGHNASENKTTTFRGFQSKTWYRIRLRVTAETLYGWIEDKRVVEHPVKGHKFTLHPASLLSKPLGISSYSTTSEIRNIRLRRVTAEEAAMEPKDE